jgi:hypothetical protein
VSVNEERLELGIAALESGEYLKGGKFLHAVDGEGRHWHCCLGVLTLEAIKHGLEISREMLSAADGDPAHEVFAGQDDEEVLCPAVMDWYGLEVNDPVLVTSSGNYRHAALWNDNGSLPDEQAPPEEDFTEIAKGFRRTFLEGK